MWLFAEKSLSFFLLKKYALADQKSSKELFRDAIVI